MLSKLFMRGVPTCRLVAPSLVSSQIRTFRSDFLNPYKHAPINLTETERKKQDELPVWDRTFDFKKYMEHDGPLKV